MSKKSLAILLSAIMVLGSCVGCSSSNKNIVSTDSEVSQSQKWRAVQF